MVIQSETLTIADPAFRDRVESLFSEFVASEGVNFGLHTYLDGGEGLSSNDGRTTVMQLFLGGTVE